MKLKMLICAVLLFGLQIFPSDAQGPPPGASRTWVSGLGDDINPCSRTAPCKTFAGAISKSAAGGVINCLDNGGFGAVTITKAISISCESVVASVLVAGTNGITVSAGANDIVTLRGLQIEGANSGSAGIKFTSGAALHVDNCTIHGFLGSPGVGISFAPTGASTLSVVDTVIRDNNQGSSAAGILIKPTGTGTVSGGTIENVKLLNNSSGLVVDGTATTAQLVGVILRNSIVAGNGFTGVSAAATQGKAAVQLTIDHIAVMGSSTGIQSSGTGANITLAYSVVTENGTGIATNGSGQIKSYQTNQLRSNLIANGTPTSNLPLE